MSEQHHYINVWQPEGHPPHYYLVSEIRRRVIPTKTGQVVVRMYGSAELQRENMTHAEWERVKNLQVPEGWSAARSGIISYSVQVPLSRKYDDELQAYADSNLAKFDPLIAGRREEGNDTGRNPIRARSSKDKTSALEFQILPQQIPPYEGNCRKVFQAAGLSVPDAGTAFEAAVKKRYRMKDIGGMEQDFIAICAKAEWLGGVQQKDGPASL